MSEFGRPSPEPQEHSPQLPDANQVVNRVYQELLPEAVRLGAVEIGGEPKLGGTEVHEKYAVLSRQNVSDVFGIPALRAEADSGRKKVEYTSDTGVKHKVQVWERGDVVKVAKYERSPDGRNAQIRYERQPEKERVDVQEYLPSGDIGITRLLGAELYEGRYSIISERHSPDDVTILVHGEFRDDPEGHITKADIETRKLDGK